MTSTLTSTESPNAVYRASSNAAAAAAAAQLARTVAESVLDSPSTSPSLSSLSYSPTLGSLGTSTHKLISETRKPHSSPSRNQQQYQLTDRRQQQQQQQQRQQHPPSQRDQGLRALALRAQERSRRRESFGPRTPRSVGLESVLEDVEDDGQEASQASERLAGRDLIVNNPTLRARTLRTSPSSLFSPVDSVPNSNPSSASPFVVSSHSVQLVASPWDEPSFPSSSSTSSDDFSDSASNSSVDEPCTTPTSCSSFGYQQDLPSPSIHEASTGTAEAYFDQKRTVPLTQLPGSRSAFLVLPNGHVSSAGRSKVIPPAVGSAVRRPSDPLPKNDYVLRAGKKEQIDLILPSLAARKVQQHRQHQHQHQQQPSQPQQHQRPRSSASLPTLSQISARLQPTSRATFPSSVTLPPRLSETTASPVICEATTGTSRLPAFLLARKQQLSGETNVPLFSSTSSPVVAQRRVSEGDRRRLGEKQPQIGDEMSKRQEAKEEEEEEKVDEEERADHDLSFKHMVVPIFTVTPPPERVEEGLKVKAMLFGRLSSVAASKVTA